MVTPTAGPDRTPYLADAAGRQVLLHGVAAVGMEDVAYPDANGGPALFPVSPSAYAGRCPKASPLIPQPPLCETQASKPAYQQSIAPASGDDFAQMRAIGFNVVRLVLNWSQLEPHPGVYSTTYLDRVAQVVGWARQQGIYLILDMHQDQYSRYILPVDKAAAPSGCSPSGGGDGAPGWAVQSDGKPGCALYGIDELNPAESAAFANFWQNSPVDGPKGQAPGTGLQDHYIGALAALANRFENDPTVLGYELMNEPQPGSLGSLPAANGYQASSQELYPFYTRAIEALTGVRDGLPTCTAGAPTSLSNTCAYPKLASVSRQQIFFEPLAYRNLLDFSIQVSKPFTTYPNIVFAPHVYTYAFTFEQDLLGLPAKPGGYPPDFTFGYQTAEAEAQAMHSAVFVTEFGDSSSTDATILAGELAAQESTQTGGTLWAWKGLSATPGTCWCTRWQFSTYQTTANGTPGKGNPHRQPSPNDLLIASRQRELMRVWPTATAGRLGAYAYDPTTSSFVMVATSTAPGPARRPGDRHHRVHPFGRERPSPRQRERGPRRRCHGARREPPGLRHHHDRARRQRRHPGLHLRWRRGLPGHRRFAVSRLGGQVEAEAAAPPAPISEPTARAMALGALTAAAHSSDKSLAANAQLVQGVGRHRPGFDRPQRLTALIRPQKPLR